jgi:Cu(I)/Ag(I) efflux system membrane protein CusA/SilA
MIGGMVSSTILTLIVIPAVYALVKGVGVGELREMPASTMSASSPTM